MSKIVRYALVYCALLLPVVSARGQEAPRAEEPGSRRTYLFQVVLLMGDNEGGSSYEGVPKNAMSALEDIRDFLPFKNYRLLDVALMRSDRIAESVMSGPYGEELELALEFDADPSTEPTRLNVHGFQLRSAGGGGTVGLGRGRVLRGERPPAADAPVAGEQRPLDPSTAARAAYARAASLAARSRRELIETSFSVDVGETIVVGSSGLDGGGKAVLVLFTAIP